MKLIALLGVGALVAGTLTAAPADAQRSGRDEYRGERYRDGGRYGDRGGYRHDGYRRVDGYRGGYGYRQAYAGRGRHGRSRVVCRLRPGHYGPVRRCFRVY